MMLIRPSLVNLNGNENVETPQSKYVFLNFEQIETKSPGTDMSQFRVADCSAWFCSFAVEVSILLRKTNRSPLARKKKIDRIYHSLVKNGTTISVVTFTQIIVTVSKNLLTVTIIIWVEVAIYCTVVPFFIRIW